jgi:GAF domain-containing protein
MNFLRGLFRRTVSNDAVVLLRLRFIQALALMGVLIMVLAIFTSVSQSNWTSWPSPILTIGLVVTLASLILSQQRFATLASVVLITLAVVLTFILPTTRNTSLIAAIVAVITAAVLYPFRLFLVISLAAVSKYAIYLIQTPYNVETTGADWSDVLTSAVILVVVAIATRYFITSAERTAQAATRNTILLQASAEIGQELLDLLDARQLFNRTVDLVRDRLGYYHVQIFMVDEAGEQAVLVASTGEVGQRLLAQKHRLGVGSGSVIGRATGFGEPVIARANQRDSIHKPNPLLPNTKSELAIPIVEGDKVICALDVQSLLPTAFQDEDLQALQTVANVLASAIRNARLFEQQSRGVQEQQRLFLESEGNLREIQRLNQQLTKAGWVDYTRQPNAQRGVTLRDSRVVPDTTWTDTLIQASQSHRPVVQQANGKPAVVAVPVILRGEIIGAIEVEPGSETDQGTTVEMVEAVAQRLAISLDNARLFEEAQAATAQEQRINSIVTRYQTATTVDDLLRITLTELSQSLGAQQGAIRLGSVEGNVDHD